MENVIIVLLQQNPWLVYPILLASCVVVPVIGVLSITAFVQGRQIQWWIFTIGPKVFDRPQAPTPIHIHPEPARIAPEQMEELEQWLAARIREIKSSEPEARVERPSNLPPLSYELDYLLRARLETDRYLGRIVTDDGGGWAGVSLAPIQLFLEYSQGMVKEELREDIKQFLTLTDILFSGGGTGGWDLEDAQVLAAHILRELRDSFPQFSRDAGT